MKAIIMAGGEGNRLRPLTCTVPKPMARLCGRPIVEYILDSLIDAGIDEAVMTLGYLPDVVENHFADGYRGMKLSFVREDEPLGTAGGVKNAAGDMDEPFLVISGDALCDFDLDKIMLYHSASKAAVTIVATEVSDPREYGIITVDKTNRVTGFVEKPGWSQAVSGLVNTGVYVVNPECLPLIKDNVPFDFAKDLFKLMLQKDMPIFCYVTDGYWCDIGNLEAYMKCQHDILDGRIKRLKLTDEKGFFIEKNYRNSGFTLVPPVYIGKGVEIEKGAVIGPYTVIDDCCYVGRDAHVRYSAALENSDVCAQSAMTGALLCSGAALKRGGAMFEGSAAGSGAIIGADCRVNSGVLIWPGKVIGERTVVSSNVKYGISAHSLLDGDEGVNDLTVDMCARLGCALGSTHAGKKTGLGYDGEKRSKAVSLAVSAGLMSAGASIWDFSECFESQLNFFVDFCGLGAGVFIGGGDSTHIKICGEGGLSIPRYFERDIEQRLAKCEFHTAGEDEMRESSDMSAMKMLYCRELSKQAPYGLSGMRVRAESESRIISDLLNDTFRKLGAVSDDSLVISIDYSGTKVSALINADEAVEFEKMLAICCLNEIKKGNDIAVPYDSPMFLDSLAARYSRKVLRYLTNPGDTSDAAARRCAAKQFFVRDGLFLAVRVLSIMAEREMSLSELVAELPQVYFSRKIINLGYTPAKLSSIIGNEHVSLGGEKEGIRLVRDNGKLLIVPAGSGNKVRVIAEANSPEFARELCADIELLLTSENESI